MITLIAFSLNVSNMVGGRDLFPFPWYVFLPETVNNVKLSDSNIPSKTCTRIERLEVSKLLSGQLEIMTQEAKTLQDLKDAGLPNGKRITFGDVIDDVKHAQDSLGTVGFEQYRSQLNKDIAAAGLPPISIIDVEKDKLVVDISGGVTQAKYNRCGYIESLTNNGVERSLHVPACDATKPKKP